MQILFVVGSLRQASLNKQCAEIIRDSLEGRGIDCPYAQFEDVPYMNQDTEFPPPGPVVRLRDQVTQADGIWFVTPEYNSSYPGLLKNMIDWISRPTSPGASRQTAVSFGKRCTLTSVAGGIKGRGVLTAMEPVLKIIGAKLMPDLVLGIGYSRQELTESVFDKTPERLKMLSDQADAFIKFVEAKELPAPQPVHMEFL